MKESEMIRDLIENLLDLPPVEFVEEYNRQTGNDSLTVDEVEFDGERLEYTIGDEQDENHEKNNNYS